MPSVVGKANRTRKTLALYRINFGHRPPYDVLCDGPTIFQSLSNDLYLKQSLPKLLGGPAYPAVTECVVKELRKLGKNYSNAAIFAKRVKRLPCVHENKVAVAECLVSRLRDSPDTNCMLATTDPDVVNKVAKIPGIPIISIINQSKFVLKAPSEATLNFVKQVQKTKTHTLSDPDKALVDQVKAESQTLFKKRFAGRKRKLVKGPNPLSIKKRKVRSENGTGNPQRSSPRLSESLVSPVTASIPTGAGIHNDPIPRRESTGKSPGSQTTPKETDAPERLRSTEEVKAQSESPSGSDGKNRDLRTTIFVEGTAEQSQQQDIEVSNSSRKWLKKSASLKNGTEKVVGETRARAAATPECKEASNSRDGLRNKNSQAILTNTETGSCKVSLPDASKPAPAKRYIPGKAQKATMSAEGDNGGEENGTSGSVNNRVAEASKSDPAQFPTADGSRNDSFNCQTKNDNTCENSKKKQRKNRRRRPKKNAANVD